MAGPIETEGALLRRNRWIAALAASPLAAALGLVVTALVTGAYPLLAFLLHTSIAGIFASLYAWHRNPLGHEVPVRLRADAGGVTADGKPLVSREELREGFVMPRPGKPPVVRLVRKGLRPPIEVAVRDESEGRRVLSALGFDVSQTVARFRLPARAMTQPAWMAATVFGFGIVGVLVARLAMAIAAPAVGPIFAVAGVLSVFGAMLLPTRAEIGADGVLLTWAWTKRFIGHGEIAWVGTFRDEGAFKRQKWTGVVLHLRSGEDVRVPVTTTNGWDTARVGMVAERVREAMEQFRSGDAAADAALVERGAREASAWLAALRALGTGASATHRNAPVAPERLWRIALDPSAAPAARAGAAIALGPTLDGEGRTRLRIAAEATASPRLRVALTAAADEAKRDEELAALLDEVDADEPERRRAG